MNLETIATATGATVECLGGNLYGLTVTVPATVPAVLVISPDPDVPAGPWHVTFSTPDGDPIGGVGGIDAPPVPFDLPADPADVVRTALRAIESYVRT